jgi:hypothetical protein
MQLETVRQHFIGSVLGSATSTVHLNYAEAVHPILDGVT